jgi:hypothetical protein
MTTRNHVGRARRGFRISDRPLVEPTRQAEEPMSEAAAGAGELPSSYGSDLLYVIARDPKSLFVYWDLDWTKLFAQAGLERQQVYLRVLREEGTEESTREIDPSAGHCDAEIGATATGYYCELGCFPGVKWKCLARSKPTATPAGQMSDDLSAQFATLPMHLSFQRMLEVLEETAPAGQPVGDAQRLSGFRRWAANRKILLASENWVEPELRGAGDLAARMATADHGEDAPQPTAAMLARWKELGEHFGGSSWAGQSSRPL